MMKFFKLPKFALFWLCSSFIHPLTSCLGLNPAEVSSYHIFGARKGTVMTLNDLLNVSENNLVETKSQ